LDDLLTRTFIAIAITGVGLSVYWFGNRVLLHRLQGKRLGLDSIRPGTPAILYFTSPGCMPCKTVQRPAIQKLMERMEEDLQVVEIDATIQTSLADYWGVLSLPTTFIIDTRGRPRKVNHGVVNADHLYNQIREVETKRSFQLHKQGAAQ
jgi:thioredoxin 1